MSVRDTHEFIVLWGHRLACACEPFSFLLKAPSLHFFVSHELYCAIADTDECKRRALPETAYALCAVYGREAVCDEDALGAYDVGRAEARTPKPPVRLGVVCTRGEHAHFGDPYWIGHDSSHGTCHARQTALRVIK